MWAQEQRTVGSSGQQHSGVTVTIVVPKGELKTTTWRLIGQFSVPFEGGHSDFFSALVVQLCKC